MFGLSLGKLLVLGAVVLFVWLGWRKLEAAGQALKRGAANGRAPSEQSQSVDNDTIDLVKDPKTGAYAPRQDDGRHN